MYTCNAQRVKLMLKKIIVGLLVLTVVGGAASALLDSQNAVLPATITPTVAATVEPTVNPAADTAANPATNTQLAGTPQPAQQSTNNVGEVWSGSGTILDLTTVGMTLALTDGSNIYVELGAPDYWQAQPVTLNKGAVVTVDGFFNGTNYHARTVTTSDGAILALRSETGQPLWSGGSNGNASNGGQGEVQIPADQWVTVEGTVTALTNNGLVVQTTDAQTLTVSFGRADFWQTQNTTFAVGDAISMLGFWQAEQFQVGQVTKTATGERILLRDPNGRPLWAGPGRGQGNGNNGNQNGNAGGSGSSSGNAFAASTGNGTGNGNNGGNGNGTAGGSGDSSGNGNGNGGSNGNGNGNQYRGQRQQTISTQQP